jgi:ANTAR domain
MTDTLATPPQKSSNGDAQIRFVVSSRAEGEALEQKLSGFQAKLVRADGSWLVEVDPDSRLTPLMLQLFNAVSEWLRESRRASVEVLFDEARFTFLHPSDAGVSHEAEFLLHRIVQLQTALETRVAIEQAKGLIAGRFRLALDEAFDLLRQAARRTGRQLHDLAEDVVSAERDLPREVRHAFELSRNRTGR